MDKELQGKVIKCLKNKFREAKLTNKCEEQMAIILREAALNYHLNPLLATMCAEEVKTGLSLSFLHPEFGSLVFLEIYL